MKNRFYQTPHCTGFGAHFPGAQAHFRGMKAEGGWAVVNTEATQISREDDFTGFGLPSLIWDDDDVRNWSLMVERVHEHGALAGIELHSGSCTSGFDSRQPARGISNVVSEALWMGSAYEMDKEADPRAPAALRRRRTKGALGRLRHRERPRRGGLGATPSMFLMNYYNKRSDEYGGSLENRARFWLETLELVREARRRRLRRHRPIQRRHAPRTRCGHSCRGGGRRLHRARRPPRRLLGSPGRRREHGGIG